MQRAYSRCVSEPDTKRKVVNAYAAARKAINHAKSKRNPSRKTYQKLVQAAQAAVEKYHKTNEELQKELATRRDPKPLQHKPNHTNTSNHAQIQEHLANHASFTDLTSPPSEVVTGDVRSVQAFSHCIDLWAARPVA